MHPKVDFEHWATVFPIETFQKTEGPRQFSTTDEGDSALRETQWPLWFNIPAR